METYLNPWNYNGKPFTSQEINENFGFVYLITHIPSNMKYIGRKYFWSMKKVKGKKRRMKVESDWKKYYGSNQIIKDMVKKDGVENFKREIICLCSGKGSTNFMETKLLFEHKVLERDDFWNDNILGKFFTTLTKKYLSEEVIFSDAAF